ncbi:MAG: biotin--[acetyl-CoA-carboxylase] ligase [Planctomycetota bacterium]|jgi:BirA family biotin operon repressor/biotin-[acetyl-CoA-carboxylase] ligase|nr:biotin--[acetyl-CoA-carboxylase] ligase [Planctomycetota bacterium]
MPTALSAPLIKTLLADPDCEIFVYPTLDSTMDEAKRRLAAGAPSKTVILAETQTAGRGRRGKSFFSPPQTGIYLSVIWRPPAPEKPAPTTTITALAAVAVCRAIEKHCPVAPQIKWVNDVLVGGKKVCGILTEAEIRRGAISGLIVGIGLNVATADFPPELRDRAGSLAVGAETRSVGSRNQLTADLLRHFFALAADRAATLDEYRARSAVLGKEITYAQDGATVAAVAVGINDAGNLLVRRRDGNIVALNSGEISLTGYDFGL